MQIFKYQLMLEPIQTIEMPAPARIISVGVQSDKVCLWVEVWPDAQPKKMIEKKIYLFGTGHGIPEDIKMKFIGTVITNEGRLVWHLYEGEL